MKHLFLPYHLAVLAKEKGFNESCIAYYNIDRNIIHCQPDTQLNVLNNEIDAPLYQPLIDWFREEHQIYIVINREVLGSDEWEYSFIIEYLPKDYWHVKRRSVRFENIKSFNLSGGATYMGAWDNYYEALNKAIEKAFTLI